jgi:MurNAc alpha-1-phosphate uridylyltransferase
MKAMILAAGEGKRLQPLTLKTPKPLLKVGPSSLIEDQINRLSKLGVNEFVINISYLGEQIKQSLRNHSHYQDISFIEESFPYGTGGALVNAMDHLGEDPFILCNADIFSEIDLSKLPSSTDAAHLIGISNPNHNQDGDFSLLGSSVIINEKANDLTWSGISLINPVILKEYLNLDFPFDIWNTIMKPLIKAQKITAHQDTSLWIDIGTIERLELARASLKEEN